MPTVAIGQATETDTASVTIARLVTPFTDPLEVTTVAGVDQVIETDLAQSLGAGFNLATQASETDLAQVVGHSGGAAALWSGAVTLFIELDVTGNGPLAATPVWTDVTSYVRSMNINRGRGSVHSEFDAGSLTLVLSNLDGRFDPNNSSSPYNPNLKLGIPVRIQAQYLTTTYDLFRGHVDVWPLDYPASGIDAIVTLECAENLALIRGDELTAQAYSKETTDTRLGNILDDVGWPAADRSLDVGVTEVTAQTYTGSPSKLVSELVEAEQGNFYIAGDGDATFKNRVAQSSTTSQATYDPGTNLGYTTVSLLYDDDTLINKVSVTGLAGAVQLASDPTSISDHGPARFASTNNSLIGEPDALNVAEWVVGRNKDVVVRVVGFDVHPHSDPTNLWPEVLGRELLELVTVKVNPPGAGDTLDQVVAIESVQHSVTPGTWVTTYTCLPLSAFETQDYWVLGTSLLNTTTVLA